MANTVTTNNPGGLGYQQGLFSGTPGTPVAQDFFDAAFAGRIHTDKIYKETYNCNIVEQCTMSTWMDEFMNYETDCYPAYSLIETNSQLQQITVKTDTTIPAYPSTGTIALANSSMFVNGVYYLPQAGNNIVLSPSGELAKVTLVTHATGYDTTLTVQLRSTLASSQAVKAGDQLLVLSGSEIADCACPTGQFAFDDLPIVTDLVMGTFGDKGSLCGDALNKCQYLKIPFTDDCGNVIEKWYTKALTDMYKRFENKKHFEKLLNPVWGIIPSIKARGIKFTQADPTQVTTDDIRAWKAALDAAGIACREYAIFAGGSLFSQYQKMLLTAGVVQLQYINRPLADCGWINMNYCGIQVEGMTLHVYEECTFSNGKLLGGPNMTFKSSAIWVPMCNNSEPVNRTSITGSCNGYNNKMLTTVYFKDQHGRVWDNMTDSNGVLGVRNTFGTGCETQEWTIKTRFLQEVHCPASWGYQGLN
jgi:hypothetical protein